MKKKTKKKLWLYKNEKRWLYHGSISVKKCAECEGLLLYFDKYDALCCPRCNLWHDSMCGDVNCEFCANRPETPEMGRYATAQTHFDRKSFFVRKYAQRLKRRNRRRLKCEIRTQDL